MTTTPTASPELLDLDKLEALARAATPGPWDLAKITDRSIEHLCPVDRAHLSLLTVVHEGETPYGAVYRDEDAMLMAAIHPEQVLALIALARRAQPEGEAPQAGIVAWYRDEQVDSNEDTQNGPPRYFTHRALIKGAGRPRGEGWRPLTEPAASLSPLCGAQPAKSGKEAPYTIGVGEGSGRLFVHGDYDSIKAAQRTIVQNELLRAQQAAAPDFRNVTAVKRISDQSLTITFSSCASCSKFERAAQLDGGQEGSES